MVKNKLGQAFQVLVYIYNSDAKNIIVGVDSDVEEYVIDCLRGASSYWVHSVKGDWDIGGCNKFLKDDKVIEFYQVKDLSFDSCRGKVWDFGIFDNSIDKDLLDYLKTRIRSKQKIDIFWNDCLEVVGE